jgi:thiol:disulfide interchange protein
MRQLVVGTSIQPQPKVNTAPTSASPANVMTIKTLSDFRDVVANEKDKIIAVRFHATWCKVS